MIAYLGEPLWIATLLFAVLAIFSGFADHRRRRRRDLDRVGIVYWPTVQVLALMGALGCAALAMMR